MKYALVSAHHYQSEVTKDNDTLTVASVTSATNGEVINNETYISYGPDENFCGTDSFDYTVSDGSDTDTATVTVTITCIHDPLAAVNDSRSTDEDISLTIDVLANDLLVDATEPLSVVIVDAPDNGTADVTAG